MPRRSAAASTFPLQCPFCHKIQVVHTGPMTEKTSFRCQECGEIWKPLEESAKVEGRSSK